MLIFTCCWVLASLLVHSGFWHGSWFSLILGTASLLLLFSFNKSSRYYKLYYFLPKFYMFWIFVYTIVINFLSKRFRFYSVYQIKLLICSINFAAVTAAESNKFSLTHIYIPAARELENLASKTDIHQVHVFIENMFVSLRAHCTLFFWSSRQKFLM